jgi:hypothetical protein
MAKKTVEKKIFTLDELKPNKHYKIKVKAFDKDKKAIGESPWIIFKTGGKTSAPPNITNLDADFKGSTLVVTWNGTSARSEKDFKEFRVRISSPNHPGVSRDFFDKDDKFNFNEDLNRKLFGSFEGAINISVYSRDTSDNESSGVSTIAYAEIPTTPTNVKLSASTLGYVVSWDLPIFKNYDYTKVYESTEQNGTYSVVRTERGTSTYVPKNVISPVWVKVSHVNKAGTESSLVASVPPSITPIDPVPTDVNPPADPTNLNWESAGLDTSNGITTALMRAYWDAPDIASGYKVRVTEDIVNKENWAVYDVPASKATVTNKQLTSNVATLTVVAHSFSVDDYITVFNVGSPFNGKHKVTSVTPTTVSFALTADNVSSTTSIGDIVISSMLVKGLTPGTTYYGAVLAYDSANNITQFVSEGTFTTSGVASTVGSAIKISGTSMAFGPAAGGAGKNGLHINNDNYWYTTGLFNVGTSGNSVSWDGVRLRLDGAILARSGSFSGNVFISGSGSNSGSVIAGEVVSILSASYSSGVGTIILQTSPTVTWQSGDRIVISQTSSAFDGQYTVSTFTGNTITFAMSTNSINVSTVTNTGSVINVTRGNRTVFNSSGIESFKDNSIVFSLNNTGISSIGGWTISSDKIFAGEDDTYIALSSSESNNWRIWAGGTTASSAPFRVNKSGNVYAEGTLVARDGTERVALGPDVGPGGQTGILIDDTTTTGISNFWYLPSTVTNGSNYFRLGTTNGSAITVEKLAGGASKVKIKDYEIEGDNNVVDDSRINVGGIKIGKNLNSTTKDGIWVDDDNYWYDPDSVSANTPMFKVRGGDQSITVNKGQNIVFAGTIAGSISTGPITTPNDFKFGNNVVGGTKDGLYFNENNFWLLPNSAIATGEVFFQIAGGSAQGTYIQIKKGTTSTTGDVYIKGYYAGGQITEPITTPPTTGGTPGNMSLGADVDGTKDGLKLSANNYWYVPESVTDGTAIFRVGGATNFLSYNPTGDILSLTGNITAASGNIGSWLVGPDSISSTGSPTYPIVLKNDVSNPRIYIGAGAHASTTTPFYADSAGRFSIGDKLFFDPSDSQSFGTLTIIGRVRGAIDNVPIVPTDSGNFTVSSVVISGTTPSQTAVLTTTATHTFAVSDTVIISGLTGNAESANGAWAVSAKTTNTFTITGISGATNGTYTGQSGTARVRELTMGLHPAFNGSPAGLGIRLDENNYWFVNNQFKIGTTGSYVQWNGTTLTVKGRIEADAGYFPAGLITGTLTASQINTTGLSTQYLNTVGGVDSFNVRVSSSFTSAGSAFVGFYNASNTLVGLINSNSTNALNISGLSGQTVTLQSNSNLFLSGTGISLNGNTIVYGSLERNSESITSTVAVSRVVTGLPAASSVQNGEIIMVV